MFPISSNYGHFVVNLFSVPLSISLPPSPCPPPPIRRRRRRRRGGAARSDGGDGPRGRARKRQKRLDAIRDNPALRPASPQPPQRGDDDEDDEEPGALRRSCRVRRAPVVLDSSPVPSHRRRKPQRGESPNRIGTGGSRKRKRRKKKKTTTLSSGNGEDAAASAVRGIEASVVENEEWRSRLRSRAKLKGRKWVRERRFRQPKGVLSKGKETGHRRKGKKVVPTVEVSEDGEEAADSEEAAEETDNLTWNDHEDGGEKASEVEVSRDECSLQVGSESDGEVNREEPNLQVGSEANREPETAEPACEAKDEDVIENSAEKEELDQPLAEDTSIPAQELENAGSGEHAAAQSGENLDSRALESEDALKEGSARSPVSDGKLAQMDVKEGRRCGCAGEGLMGDRRRYWFRRLLRILGPIHDRFGIARVWVHQNCAVWSPEVYFAGLGCLKNVRAALCRGRALKCSRCGRPGATIGCRVDRCPKTYHLPCSRAEGCVFDHRKFLIACSDHQHHFQPQGDLYAQLIRKRKAKKLKLDMRKLSHEASRKDLEAEEKWLENCGEDEEFLKREAGGSTEIS
uniref:PHD-type domain-containing protein n=1 Tax=Ananas comosus var. bracteatus TaxID=296719 RepID=A0A6V7NZQ1_ANACO|nr:unnamed protein product [Ananas comosus var. bracteatus]